MLDTILSNLNFEETHRVSGKLSINDLFSREKRCGIYVLHFGNGELYAGQAIDVCRRYGQHRKIYKDINAISFQCVSPQRLSSEEKKVIHSLEKAGFHLRNIVHTSVTYAPSPFDEIMLPEEQNHWLNDPAYIDADGGRYDDSELRRKYTKKYEQFLKLPYADEFIHILRLYIQNCIPAFVRSEMFYWCCTCLLDKRPNNVLIYSRINVYRQEVFTVGTEEGTPFFSWHISNSPLQTSRKRFLFFRLPALKNYKGILNTHRYQPGGQDQVNLLSSGSIIDAVNILQDTNIIRAMRQFNLYSMRKGANWYYRYHCFDLADRLLEG